jgi:hypothetical protein
MRRADLHVVQRGQRAEEVEALGAERAPEALHLAARGRVAGARVEQRDAEALAGDAQDLAAVGGAIVEVERVGGTVATERGDEEAEHVDLALLVVRLERDDEARGVVEERVDAERLPLAVDEQRRPVADVALPERTRALGLPAQSGLPARAALHGRAVEALLAVEAPHGRVRDGVLAEAAVEDERPHDHRHRRSRVLAADVEEVRALLGGQLARAT